MAPPGTRVLVHEKPGKQGTWAPHAQDAWYLGPALLHYCCYCVYMWATQRERTPDTITWFPINVKMPVANSLDTVVAAAHAIIHALKNPSAGSALAPLQDTELKALQKISELLLNQQPVGPTTQENATISIEPTPQQIFTPTMTNRSDQPVLRVPTSSTTMGKTSKNSIPTHPILRVHGKYSNNETSETTKNFPLSKPREKKLSTCKDTPLENYQSVITFHPTIPTNTKCTLRHHIKNAAARMTHTSEKYVSTSPNATFTSWPKQKKRTRKPKNKQPTLSANSALHSDTGELVEYQKLLKSTEGPLWERSCLEEIARLAQGLPDAGIPVSEGTNTIFFIPYIKIPTGRKPTYLRIVVADRPQKKFTTRSIHRWRGQNHISWGSYYKNLKLINRKNTT